MSSVARKSVAAITKRRAVVAGLTVAPTRCQEPLGVHEQRVQRADERLGAGSDNDAATGFNEERIAEEVTQLRE